MKKISQKTARAALKRVVELEEQRADERRSYARSYPGGTNLGSLTLDADWFRGRLEAAQMLKHPLVVVVEGTQCKFYALPTA